MDDPRPFHEIPGHVWDLAPPAEIRRRGEARARRRRAGTSLGGLVLIAVVTTPLFLGVGGTRTADVATDGDPARSSPPSLDGGTWLQSIPASFALDTGMGTPDTPAVLSDREQDVRRVTVCGRAVVTASSGAGASDALLATGSDAAGSLQRRVLLVYPDPDAARGALRAVRRSADLCLAAAEAGENMISLGIGTEPVDWSWAYLFPQSAGLGPEDEVGSLLVGRVGNAVLVDQWAGGPSAVVSADDRLPQHVLGVLQDMCVFDKSSC